MARLCSTARVFPEIIWKNSNNKTPSDKLGCNFEKKIVKTEAS